MPQEKSFVTWQNSYSVNLGLIDKQHMHLINLTNELFAACMTDKEKTRVVFQETIREIVDYTRYHFTIEEKLMERVNYVNLGNHKQEHTEFVMSVHAKLEGTAISKPLAPLNFAYFLRGWILNHIAHCDKKMGAYFQAMHKSGELEKMTIMVKKDETTNRLDIK